MEHKLKKLQAYRNAIAHNNGIIRDIDIKKTRIKFEIDNKVELDSDYVKFAFILIQVIVINLENEIKNKFY